MKDKITILVGIWLVVIISYNIFSNLRKDPGIDISKLKSCLSIDEAKYPSQSHECVFNAIDEIGDIRACNWLKKDESPIGRDECYRQVAVSLKKPEHCDLISDKESYYLRECVSRTATSEAECEKIKKVEGRSDCYKRVAVLNQDIKICLKIKGTAFIGDYPLHVYNCVTRVARSSLNTQLCDFITNQQVKDMCVTQVKIEIEQMNPPGSAPCYGEIGKDMLECYVFN